MSAGLIPDLPSGWHVDQAIVSVSRRNFSPLICAQLFSCTFDSAERREYENLTGCLFFSLFAQLAECDDPTGKDPIVVIRFGFSQDTECMAQDAVLLSKSRTSPVSPCDSISC